MLKLKRIEINKTTASAYYYPENSKKAGHIVVALETGEVLERVDVPGYGDIYVGHAVRKLVRLSKEENHASECVVVWY